MKSIVCFDQFIFKGKYKVFTVHQLLLLQEERERQLAREWRHQMLVNEAKQLRQQKRSQKSVMPRLVLLARRITHLVRASVAPRVSRKGNHVHDAAGAELPIHFPNALGVDSNDSQAA